jgi:hypothetical protein
MKKITFLFLPLFCLILLGAGCAEKQDFDENTSAPVIENNVVPMYEINLDDGHLEGGAVEIDDNTSAELTE